MRPNRLPIRRTDYPAPPARLLNPALGGLTLICLLAALSMAAARAQLPMPPLDPNGESGAAVAFLESGGPTRWTSTWSTRPDTLGGRPVVQMEESGAGAYSGFENEVRWRTETSWSGGAPFVPLQSEKTFSDTNGAPLVRLSTEFDHENHVIRFEREDLGTGESEIETFDLPDDTLWVEGIAAAIRAMPFDETSSVSAHLFTPEPALYEVTFELRGREAVRTNEGEVECYKIEVVPHVGLLGLLRFLLPDAYFWIAVEEPHTWIRYEGPENGRGTPLITMEVD